MLSAFVALVVVPIPTFLAARTFAIWIQPRLRLYVQLADYLRVMWVPIGGFAVGYLAILVIFASFFGMLERFVPGSFSGAADAGVLDWIAFSFYSAIADPSSAIGAVSATARFLVGTQLVFSIGWALVVFAAVMSAIQPQLGRDLPPPRQGRRLIPEERPLSPASGRSARGPSPPRLPSARGSGARAPNAHRTRGSGAGSHRPGPGTGHAPRCPGDRRRT